MPRGLFIVFEGGDRCGKTTQAKLLERKYTDEKIPFEVICYPSMQRFN